MIYLNFLSFFRGAVRMLPMGLCAGFMLVSPMSRADALDTSLEQYIKAFDTNADGGLSREEMQSGRRAASLGRFRENHEQMFLNNFPEMDADHNGVLSAVEISNAITQRYRKADASSKEQLSLQDAQRGMPMVARNYSTIDITNQGSVSLQQVRDFFAARVQTSMQRRTTEVR